MQRIEVDLDHLTHNVEIVKRRLDDKIKTAFVVKADGYGHGLVKVARIGEAASLDYLAVSNISSAKKLREVGITTPVLVFGPIYRGEGSVAEMVDLGVIPTITSKSISLPEEMDKKSKSRGVTTKVHLNVDTGMGRTGLFPNEVLPLLKRIRELRNLKCEGIYSHLSAADSGNSKDRKYTLNQIEEFRQVLLKIDDEGLLPPLRHLGNSAGFIQYESEVTKPPLNMVRMGSLFYGLPEAEAAWTRELIPTMSVFTRIAEIRELPAGSYVGYRRTSRIREDKEVGVLPMGYADGFNRKMSKNGEVSVNNQKAPVIGKVSANHATIDLSKIDRARVGDRVEIVGRNNSVTELGKKIGASVLELVHPFGVKSYERIYLGDHVDENY